jgi:hypothetical protein
MRTMSSFIETSRPVRSLAWTDGGDLYDPVGGGRRWSADGTEHDSTFFFGFSFDRAIAFGRFWVVYVERGTKALLLKDGKVIRELNRSFYCADAYDYPVTLGTLADGRVVVIHCPDEYNILQIEDAETGERLTTGKRQPADVFHSQLAISPDGRRLLSVGWLWHPFGVAAAFELDQALKDPVALDGDGILPTWRGIDAEVMAGRWIDAERVVLATGAETLGNEVEGALGPNELGVWSFAESVWVRRHQVDVPVGALVVVGESVISLYGHPRRISLATGEVIAEWPELELPERQGCLAPQDTPPPVVALHPDGRRLAIAQETGIAVVDLVP